MASAAAPDPGGAPRGATPGGRAAAAWRGAIAAWRRFEAAHDAVFDARWGYARRREARRQQDTLRALLMLDTLGVDNPVAYETLELIPYMVADLHEWHRRTGSEEFGDARVCC